MIKSQDIVILAALMRKGADAWTFAQIAQVSGVSVSEAHAGVLRLQKASLLDECKRIVKSHALEFLVHGLKYAFPAECPGRMVKGLPTAYAAPVAADEFASSGAVPVWQTDKGTVYGRAVEPLYPTVPDVAMRNPELYARLAVFDMIRGGRLRERKFAEDRLKEMFP